jgi:hypothetical protein
VPDATAGLLASACAAQEQSVTPSAAGSVAAADDPLVTLVPGSLTVTPQVVAPGGQLTVQFAVNNPLDTPVNAALGFSIRAAGTTDWTADPANDIYADLPVGDSVQTRTFTVPADAAEGVYDAAWDIRATFGEGTPWDSVVLAGQVTVAQPHLAADSLTVTPQAVLPGGQLTVQFAVNNPFDTPVHAALGFSIRAAGATDWIADPAGDVYADLAPGDSVVTRTFTVPAGAAEGVYDAAWDIRATFGEGTPWDSVVLAGQVKVTQPHLAAGSLTVTPTAVLPGSQLTVQFAVNNPFDTPVHAALGFSIRAAGATDWTADPANDIYADLPVGDSVQTRTFTVPAGAAEGVYDAAWDIRATFGEGTPWDSVVLAGQIKVTRPDLLGESLTVEPTTADAGDTVTATYIIANNGSATSADYRVDFYLCSGPQIAASSVLLGSATVHGGLAADGQTDPLTATFTLPAQDDAFYGSDGTYYVAVVVDAGHAVDEANEANNSGQGVGLDTAALAINRVKHAAWLVAYYLSNGDDARMQNGFQAAKFKAIDSGADNSAVLPIVLYDFYAPDQQDAVFEMEPGLTDPSQYTRGVNMWYTTDLGLGPEAEMGDPATLTTFGDWALDHFTADHFAMVLFDHGSGWKPTGALSDDVVTGAEDSANSPVGITSSGPSALTTGICTDNGDPLTTAELGAGLGAIAGHHGAKIDVVHLDACLMQGIEVGFQLRDSTSYLVGNINQGWMTIPSFENQYLPEVTMATGPAAMATLMATGYDSFLDNWGSSSGTANPLGHAVSVIDLERIGPVYYAVQALGARLTAALPGHGDEILTARNATQKYDEDANGVQNVHDGYIDLKDFALQLQADVTGADAAAVALRAAAHDLAAAMNSDYIIYNANHNGWGYAFTDALGQSIYFPENAVRASFAEYNAATLEFCGGAWDNFLRAMITPPELSTLGAPTMTNVTEGQAAVADITLRNDGQTAAAASHVQLYLSTGSGLDTAGAYALGEMAVPALQPGQSATLQWNFIMPDLGAGVYAVQTLVQADSQSELYEGSAPRLLRGATGFTVSDPPTAAPAAVTLRAASDLGQYADDDITSLDNSGPTATLALDVSGTLPQATVILYADGLEIGRADAVGPVTTVTTDGRRVLADGSHTITARQILPGCLTSTDSPTLAISIDTQAPAADAPTLSAAAGTGVAGNDLITQGLSPELGLAPTDAAVGGYASGIWKVIFTSDDGKSAEADGPAWSAALATLTEGARQITATVYDRAGNVFTTAPLTITVDRTPPAVTAVSVNGYAAYSMSSIFSGVDGIQTITISFSEPVAFTADAVTVVPVTFVNGVEAAGPALTPVAVSGSGTAGMTLTLAAGSAVDTWNRVTLSSATAAGASGVADLAGNALDGEPSAAGTASGYLRGPTDLPSGDGTAGGSAVFYVGSLLADANGDGFVDGEDYGVWQNNYNSPNPGPSTADFNGDGIVDGEDYGIWQNGYNGFLPQLPVNSTVLPTAVAANEPSASGSAAAAAVVTHMAAVQAENLIALPTAATTSPEVSALPQAAAAADDLIAPLNLAAQRKVLSQPTQSAGGLTTVAARPLAWMAAGPGTIAAGAGATADRASALYPALLTDMAPDLLALSAPLAFHI